MKIRRNTAPGFIRLDPKLVLRKDDDENISVKNMLGNLSTILRNYTKLNKENEANKVKIQELEAKIQELETFQAEDEVLL